MAKRKVTLSDALRQAIKASGQTLYRLSKNCDVDPSSLLRFMHKQRGLTLDSAGRVAEALDLELRKRGE